MSYEVGSAVEVRAFHVMPGAPEPEGSLHAHDYRIDVVVERGELDEAGMVCDLDILDAALAAVADEVRDADLDRIRPPEAEAVTVEVFARWAHGQLAPAVRSGGGEMLSVRVWESPVAFGGYKAPA
ncbi:MAG: 6-pyruvoyl tetrahydropterin synthase family protein [Acidimicrobiales bacterium]